MLGDVPTAKESGFPSYIVTSWNGLTGHAGLPSDVLNLLNAEINRALAAPDLAQKATTLGIDARGSTLEEMHDRLAQDAQKWRQVIAQAGIPKQ